MLAHHCMRVLLVWTAVDMSIGSPLSSELAPRRRSSFRGVISFTDVLSAHSRLQGPRYLARSFSHTDGWSDTNLGVDPAADPYRRF